MTNHKGKEIKMDETEYYPKKSRKPLQAIRHFRFECMGWDRLYKDSGKPYEDVKDCPDEMCPLFDFRLGKNPYLKGKSRGNLEALKKARETLQLARQNQ